jgi:DNA-binding response OmpR family regulator
MRKKMKRYVLLVEDEIDLATTLIDYLELEDIACDYAANGLAGQQLLNENQYDMVMLDINMPRMNGLTLCEKIRAKGDETPVLMLTARDTIADKLAGFKAGSDDYLVKPFDMLELVARIHALANRRSGQARVCTVEDLIVNFSKKTAQRKQRLLQLTPTAWIILDVLMHKSPNIVTRDQLSRAVWGDEIPDSDSLKVHLFKLRQQVDGKNEEKLIHTFARSGIALRKGEAFTDHG